jgi:hypothetical protein
LFICGLKFGDLLLEPNTKVTIHFHAMDGTTAEAATIPSCVRQQAALLHRLGALGLKILHAILQSPTFSDVLLILNKKSIAAFLVCRTITVLHAGVCSGLSVSFAFFEVLDN